jgi:hypothetical protein
MNTKINALESNLPEQSGPEGRREAVQKLGKYAGYAIPFTLLAVNTRASQTGTGVGGRRPARNSPQPE